MRLITLLICSLFAIQGFSQTSITEYLFLTRDYPEAVAKGHTPDLQGYYLEDLLELKDGTGWVKLLYQNNQQSIIPVATQLTIFSDDNTFYICVPHEKSGKEIFNRYSDDIQSIFSKSSKAQSIFSVLMVQYPIELQKFYDEIKALEEVYTKENTTTNPIDEGEPVVSVKDNSRRKNNRGSKLSGESTTKGGSIEPKVTTRKVEKPKERGREPKASTDTRGGASEPIKIVSPNATGSVGITDYTKSSNDRLATGRTSNEISSSLRRRKLLARPEFQNPTGKGGHVRIDICLDSRGKVISAKYSRNMSNTQNIDLVEWSKKLAKQYRFAKSGSSRQCGYILFKYN